MIDIDFNGKGAYGTGRYTVYVAEGKELAEMMKTDDLEAVLKYKKRIRTAHRSRPPQVFIYDRMLKSFDLEQITRAVRREKREMEEQELENKVVELRSRGSASRKKSR